MKTFINMVLSYLIALILFSCGKSEKIVNPKENIETNIILIQDYYDLRLYEMESGTHTILTADSFYIEDYNAYLSYDQSTVIYQCYSWRDPSFEDQNLQIWRMDKSGENKTKIVNGRLFQVGGISKTNEIAYIGIDNQVYVTNFLGSYENVIVNDDLDKRFPQWSPDNNKIAYLGGINSYSDTFDIYIVDADGSNKQKITSESIVGNCERAGMFRWAADGSKIVFTREFESQYNIHVIDINTSTEELLASNVYYCCGGGYPSKHYPVFFGLSSSDAVVNYINSSDCNLYSVPITGGSPTNISNETVAEPECSIDGEKIAYTVYSSKSIVLINYDGSNRKTIFTNDEYFPSVEDVY